ncbi:aldo-keto reductase family 1 member B1-like [Anopheles maculipalpis]|uniref:aldo-keto reductase family 1 member B1-like n=1 Tax=Anopheles maculipalpis TaxID=1496333 RepID=UPI002158B710|nr:aldo-keto reductase family 1 member B1-like [Anopheles maculipalpis]
MPARIPHVFFKNGASVPVLGLGTWNSPPGQVTQAVRDAILVGYRHIDCAHVYENEHEVGAGIAAKIDKGYVKREDLFVTSKLWNTFHRPDLVQSALKVTLRNLNLKYLDLYLIHWPQAYREGDELFPLRPDGKRVHFSDVDYVNTWPEMERLVDAGLVRNIGLSNFNVKQVQRILDVARIAPVTNQIECHPYLHQDELREFCNEQEIIITAYSPLGSPARPWAKQDDPILMQDPMVKKLAKKHSKSPAQILIRYQIQLGNLVIPKSVSKQRIAANADVFDFELGVDDMIQLAALERSGRICPESFSFGHPHHPFEEEFRKGR